MSASKYYFDQAATSFPKAEGVVDAVTHFLTSIGANPGRGSYDESTQSGEILFECRQKLAQLLGVKNPMRVILTHSATMALNMAIAGVVKKGAHVVTTTLEHNSTIRVLKELQLRGDITLSIVPIDPRVPFELQAFEEILTKDTSLLVCNHASNVWGTVLPLEKLISWAKSHSLISIVDASQTVGTIPIEMERMGIDILCFSGHKSLLGPMGTGAMAINSQFDLEKIVPVLFGGTGSHSSSIEQPRFIPDAFESGTLNLPGFAGVSVALDYIEKYGVDRIHQQKRILTDFFSSELAKLDHYIQYIDPIHLNTGVLSFNHIHHSASKMAEILARNYHVACRVGLHCAPLAHQTIGTFPDGTVRFSFSHLHTIRDLSNVIDFLREI